jgi:serine/threonine-protein kinase
MAREADKDSVAGRALAEARGARATFVAPLVVALVGVLLSAAVAVGVALRLTTLRRADLQRLAVEQAADVERNLQPPLEVARTIPDLFGAAGDVSREGWTAFARGPLRRHPGLYAVEWLPVIPERERAAWESRARADGLEAFALFEPAPGGGTMPAAPRERHVVVFYMEPPNTGALGFDIASDALRMATADAAVNRGSTAVSERFRLLEDPQGVWSAAVYEPVYRRGEPTTTAEERRAALRGYGVVLFRIGPLVAPVVAAPAAEQLDLLIVDETAKDREARVVYEARPGLAAAVAAQQVTAWTSPVTLGDRRWSVVSVARDPVGDARRSGLVVLLAGALLSAALGFATHALRTIAGLRKQIAAAHQVGQYTLEEKLGEGGMGVVYKARHTLLRRPTAVKLLRATGDDEHRRALARFRREVEQTSRLTHPNTIAIYDYGHTPDGVFYYVMEYLDGVTLEQLVRRDGPLPAARVVHVLRQVTAAIREAHEAGLVHRDLKPANVMLCFRGGEPDFAKVLDFGLVKKVDMGVTSEVSTAGGIIGTPIFLAPEQLVAPDKVDARADLYAIGGLAYWMLTGRTAVDGPTMVAVMTEVLTKVPEPPSKLAKHPVPASLDALVLRCLAKSASDRFPTAGALLDALDACAKEIPWSEAEARKWWKERAPRLLRHAEPSKQGQSSGVVEVDLTKRDGSLPVIEQPDDDDA